MKEFTDAEEQHNKSVAEGQDEAMELRRSTNSWVETLSMRMSIIEERVMHIKPLPHEVVRGMLNKFTGFEPQGDATWLLRGIQDDSTAGELMMRRFYSADVEANKIRVEVQMGLSVLCFEACRRRLEGIDGNWLRRAQLSVFSMLRDIENEQLYGDEENRNFGLFQWAIREPSGSLSTPGVVSFFGARFSALKRRFWGLSLPFSESVDKIVHNGGIESVWRRVWDYFPKVSKKVLEFCQKPVCYTICRVRQKTVPNKARI